MLREKQASQRSRLKDVDLAKVGAELKSFIVSSDLVRESTDPIQRVIDGNRFELLGETY